MNPLTQILHASPWRFRLRFPVSPSRDVQPNPAVYDTASSGYNQPKAKPTLRAARAPPAVYDTASNGPPPGMTQKPRGPVYDLGNNADNDAGYLDISSDT